MLCRVSSKVRIQWQVNSAISQMENQVSVCIITTLSSVSMKQIAYYNWEPYNACAGLCRPHIIHYKLYTHISEIIIHINCNRLRENLTVYTWHNMVQYLYTLYFIDSLIFIALHTSCFSGLSSYGAVVIIWWLKMAVELNTFCTINTVYVAINQYCICLVIVLLSEKVFNILWVSGIFKLLFY